MFDSLIGQDHIKRALSFYTKADKSSGTIPRIMFNGAKGLGKTEFAKQFAKALKKPLLEINCSTIKNSKQFFEQIFIPVVMGNEITLLFDEAHALPNDLQAAFLTVFNVESGVKRKDFAFQDSQVEFNFEKQVYLFATTEPDKLFAPLRDRFEEIDFKPYMTNELSAILQKKIDWVVFEDGIINVIAESLRGNARSAVKRSQQIGLFCNNNNTHKFGAKEWKSLCHTLNIHPSGLTNTELEVLNILKTRGPCTLTMLSATTGLSRTSIQRDAELHLLRKGLIKIEGTRQITPQGVAMLK